MTKVSDYLDRSGTDFNPLPAAVKRLPHGMQVFLGTSLGIALGTGIYLYRRRYRKVSRTETAEWQAETKRLAHEGWPREAGEPVEANPIRHRRQGSKAV